MSTATPALVPLPPTFERSRFGLHRVAEQIVAPARKPQNEISLQATPRGFGTPEFEHDGAVHQVRVEGAELVHAVNGAETRASLDSLAAAAATVAGLLPPDAELDDEPLGIEADASLALGALYEFGNRVLETLIAEAPESDAPSVISLWPEHFDIAIESGDEAAGRRANYGFSPGDEHHPEPYLYVGPWDQSVAGPLWDAAGFVGAELSYSELAAADDPVATALEFCRIRRDELNR